VWRKKRELTGEDPPVRMLVDIWCTSTPMLRLGSKSRIESRKQTFHWRASVPIKLLPTSSFWLSIELAEDVESTTCIA
jgi:hypothetical protein